ncbi:MAG: tetratricopeptide repeat protein [Candidatus Latescibacterota bacterium]|nr:MAG: tetratricopeptide repeat protein [Candidatus Latescibacterota bacterium]
MGKPNNIRKRALDFAKKRQWGKALEEFERLVDIERSNPNVHNEIGDLYLKLGNKREAFKSFHTAVDAYSSVSLHNNAVAVCKKILRLNPNDQVVYGKLAKLRHQQGFHREATTHAMTFFDKILDVADEPGDGFKDLVLEIVHAAGDTVEILERAAEYLMKCRLNDDAGTVLERLDQVYAAQGMTSQRELVQKHMESIGYVPSGIPDPKAVSERLETVESAGDRFGGDPIGFDGEPDDLSTASAGGGQSTGAVGEYGMVDLAADPKEPSGSDASAPADLTDLVTADATGTQGRSDIDVTDGQDSAVTSTVGDFEMESSNDPSASVDMPSDLKDVPKLDTVESIRTSAPETLEPGDVSAVGDEPTPQKEWVIPTEDSQPEVSAVDSDGETVEAGFDGGKGVNGQPSPEVTADIDDEDYRSHYDLGMAYLEMNLLPEAIREFQFASNSSTFRVRSLEMIGRCFIKQDKPQLAIKQLTRGLALVGDDDRDSLGIRYSLGVAHEMVGELEKAKSYFEDVYVVDVTFRDVDEKMKKFNA